MKKRINLFWIGLVLLILAGLMFGASMTIDSVSYDSVSRVYTSWTTAASLNSDRTVLALVDSSDTLYWVDKETDTVESIISVYELGMESPLFYGIDFDSEDNLYLHVADTGSDSKVHSEYLCKVTEGEVVDLYTLYEGENTVGYRSIFALRIEDNAAYYIRESATDFSIIEYDFTQREENVITTFDFLPDRRIVTAQRGEDDRFIVTTNDGYVFKVSFDGQREDIASFNYECGNTSDESIYPGLFSEYKGAYYFIDEKFFSTIYKYDAGELEAAYTLKQLYDWDMEEDITDRDYMVSVVDYAFAGIFADKDSLIIASNGNLVIDDGNEIEKYMYTDEGISLNKHYVFQNVIKKVLYYGAFVIGIIGIICILIYIIKFYFSVFNKIIFLLIPVVIAAFTVITVNITSRIEKMYYDSAYEKLVSISDLCAKSLDVELIKEIDSLEDIDNGNLRQLKNQMAEILENSASWGDGIFVNLYRFENSFCHHQIVNYPETEEGFLNTYYYEDFKILAEHRVGNSNTYSVKTDQPGYTYVDAITVIYDGEDPIALFDVYSYNDSIQENVQAIKRSIILIAIITTVVLCVLLLFLANYITLNLRKSKNVIEKISGGDLSARVQRISKDEIGVIATGVNDMAGKLEELFANKEKFSKEVIETLVGTIDAKDKYTNGHSLRVAKYSKNIAARLGKSQQEQDNIYYAGLLHDIGKIGVPDEIINKTSRLDDSEYSIIKTHPEIGYDLLKNLSEIQDISIGAYGHHERYDGKGYPRGLKGEENPEIARIISVADAYDAMTSNRSYRNAMSQEKVRSEIEKGSGTQFDPKFAKIMLEMDTDMAPEIYGATQKA